MVSIVKNQKGFTLIELLVVIAILGILAAIIVPNATQFIGKSEVTAANAEAHMVRTASIAYMAAMKGEVATTTDDLQPFLTGKLKGSYDINSDGTIVGTAYPAPPADPKLVWNSETEEWEEPD